MSKTSDSIKWGIIGTGKIASDFCIALTFVGRRDHKIVAVASRNLNKAEEFASNFCIKRCYGSYLKLCSDPSVDIVYVGTVTSDHFSSTMMALQSGKHVLCEKPMSITLSQCEQVIQLAKSKNLLFVEGVWSKFLPSYSKIREELRNCIIGNVLMLSIEFGLKFDWDSRVQIVDKFLGGGTTLGLGCYAVHFANLVFNCERPTKIIATGKMHSKGLDEESQITLIYSGGRIAQISLSTTCNYSNDATIYGTKGFIRAKNFWCCEEVQCPSGSVLFNFTENTPETNYPKTIGFCYEIQKVREILLSGKISSDEVSHQDSLIASEVLNQAFEQLELNYSNEEPINLERKSVGWGIISTGRIANDFCLAMNSILENGHKIIAVSSRNIKDAKMFAEKYNILRYYGDYKEILQEKEVDIVYIACVNSLHAELSKFFLSAGKAVLCEKPMTTTFEDTLEVIECAKKFEILFVEGFWTRYFPAYKQLRKELKQQTIGNIRLVHIEFGVPFDWISSERISRKDLGGGITLDIGCYAIQLACLIFKNKYPSKIIANGTLHNDTGVDNQVAVTLLYDDQASAQILLNGSCALSNSATIYGTLGKIFIPSPFWCPSELQTPSHNFTFEIPSSDNKYEYINSGGLIYEIEAVREAFISGLKEMPEITLDECLLISKIQSEILHQINV